MCGIGGFIDQSGELDEATLTRMQESLRHRGPDDRGLCVLTEGAARIGLAHTRLSILDLSEAGHQPMRFGSLTIVYNGEIYNFRELRETLAGLGHTFHTDCDTEVILHAFSEWGVDCLARFIGMFAFVLHDSRSRKIYFVRDRAGVKPLYIHTGKEFWLFGSELKALRSCSRFSPEICVEALHAYFRHGHVPDSACIYAKCHKVDAGTYWVLDTETMRHRVVRWWDQTQLLCQEKTRASFEECVDELEELLHSTCAYRLVSDVPVGVFLSGGYDSTAVAAILQSRASSAIKTFTIGFTEGNDEAPAARQIAKVLGTEHHEFYCSPNEALEVIPRLPDIYDEPFADSSGIPTTLVSRLAREHAKVALSADAGDELFCGYDSYPATWSRVSMLSRVPPALRPGAEAALKTLLAAMPRRAYGTRHKLDAIASSMNGDLALMAQRLHGSSRLMPRALINELLPSVVASSHDFQDRAWPADTHPLDASMGLDYQTYLKDDILTKVDRATMSVGLEGREPLLDQRLAEFAARLPMQYKIQGNIRKRILREVVQRHVPAVVMDRPKTGFSLPIMRWLRAELAEQFDQVFSVSALAQSPELDSQTALSWAADFRNEQFHYTPLIWRLFVYQTWRARWLSG